ncbi:uncharacterized protein G2W53_033049 [Senna tora]|uniref:Uncharacterized protein n=1 Tax=Senna tora TaxID=362788 RepID=A0A834W859_9FABA|nr:uncharacterized protein G2W53_033049 [Senna tora]
MASRANEGTENENGEEELATWR